MFQKKQLLPIIYYPDEVLLKPASNVAKVTNDTRSFISNMIYTMHKNDGVGIAAPQVGVSQRIVICALDGGDVALINPKITYKSLSAEVGNEGCLSLPSLYGDVLCASEVTVEYTDYKGKLQKITASGRDARVIQHELVHLDGKTILDTADPETFAWVTGEEDEEGNLISRPVTRENAILFFERNYKR